MKASKLFTTALGLVMGASIILPTMAACKGDEETNKPDALVLMSEAVDGLFNPFYSTTSADNEIIGMTQIGMLSTDYEGEAGKEEAVVAYGEDEPVVVLDYDISYDENEQGDNQNKKGVTTYRFVVKNGIKYSDGKPLTMNDVLFNMYVYLDPVYTGSSTMYSTDIIGLQAYRTQTNTAGGSEDSAISGTATNRAKNRINELKNLYSGLKTMQKDTSIAGMEEAISNHSVSLGYKEAFAPANDSEALNKITNENLLADYKLTQETFKKELGTDYEAAKDAYTEEPYKSQGFDEITSFMFMEGYVKVEYEKKLLSNGRETDDKSKIKKVERNYDVANIKTKEDAIDYVFNAKIESELDAILTYWATANTLRTEYIAKATEAVLREAVTGDELTYANISGIQSLGHLSDANRPTEITLKNADAKTYKVAQDHNDDGTVKGEGYDVLQIKINGVDPKAIWNFGFGVAPQHYYAEGREVDIANNEFGVEWGSFDFMKNEIQSTRNVKVPVGAGPYVATDANNNDNPDGNEFHRNNVIYFKANKNFMLGEPKIKKLRYQVVSANNALGVLEQGSVHFVSPQYTKDNAKKIDELKSKGIESKNAWQLGYGYIGINAGKVTDINLRKAIMSAMDTSRALSYYSTQDVQAIAWPMSTVSWAYPKNPNGTNDDNNLHDYTRFRSDEEAIANIEYYMGLAGVNAGDSRLKIQFTIAGSNLSEHPTYSTFNHAMELLNSCGWQIEVIPDVNALNKLSTGALSVWAAAWGSTIDPDMYQVYHKDSTATSTIAWGYRAIKENQGSYPIETSIIETLSGVIDEARETEDRETRKSLYKEAMGYVLDLAIEMPVYQRKNLYVYNTNVIKASSLPEVINPYSSPLAKIWEVELVD
ncbi:MAG: hypothetical protein IJB34_07590 [Clostridia bacterium]|nr:hypothetical protein [Clostridia bacterium]